MISADYIDICGLSLWRRHSNTLGTSETRKYIWANDGQAIDIPYRRECTCQDATWYRANISTGEYSREATKTAKRLGKGRKAKERGGSRRRIGASDKVEAGFKEDEVLSTPRAHMMHRADAEIRRPRCCPLSSKFAIDLGGLRMLVWTCQQGYEISLVMG